MSISRKYGRNGKTFHVTFSPGTDSTDRKNWKFLDNIFKGVEKDEYAQEKGFEDVLPQNPIEEIVVTEKLDGQGVCFNEFGLFARSHGAPSELPWDKTLRQKHQLIKNDLKDFKIEIFGENVYAVHSIEYLRLEHDFYAFAVRQGDQWLSWEEVEYWAEMFDFPTVPVLAKGSTENFFTDEKSCEKYINGIVQGSSVFGSIDYYTKEDCTMEGVVFRNADKYHVNNFVQNVFKWVRKGHVKPRQEHWTKSWRPAFKLFEIEAFYGKQGLTNEECKQALIVLEKKRVFCAK